MLKAGFARLDITPPLGITMEGYYHERRASGMLDPLLASAVAFNDTQQTVVLVSLDVIGINQSYMEECRNNAAQLCGLPSAAVFVACTHTHQGPVINDSMFEVDSFYCDLLKRRIADVVRIAIADLQPANLSIGRNAVQQIAFVRRFLMKDGSIRTNPGRRNPQVVRPIGEPDESVQLLKITRDNADEILLVNFQVHPDVISGNLFSADYPGFVRRTLEKTLDQVKCIYFNGAQGDLNHINVNAPEWDANGGYDHSRHMGRSIAAAVLQIYDKAEPIKDDKIRCREDYLHVPTNKNLGKISEAEQIIALHEAGKDDELPEYGMGITTLVAEAYRIKNLANGPDAISLRLVAVRCGDFAITGAPGEPFNAIGRLVKAASPYAMTFYCCCANGYEGYFPTLEAYNEGGYEARSARFKAGVAETLIEAGGEMLKSLSDGRP